MYFGVGDVYVNISRKSISVKPKFEPLGPTDLYEAEWLLEVRAMDAEFWITGKASHAAPMEIITSCLLAGLKKVAEPYIFNAACARIESQFGFAVDRWISPDIANVVSQTFSTYGVEFEVIIVPTIFATLVGEPKITANYIEDIPEIRLDMHVNGMKSSLNFSIELWELSFEECMEIAKFKFLESLYKEHPGLSHLWTQIRYNWQDMGQMSDQGVAWFNKIQGSSSSWLPDKSNQHVGSKQIVSHTEDRRVRELPGLNEQVKHPESGKTTTVRAAIISLNDSYKWSREKIADWLDTLDIDLQFKVSNNEQD